MVEEKPEKAGVADDLESLAFSDFEDFSEGDVMDRYNN